jgi:hypothetical protein
MYVVIYVFIFGADMSTCLGYMYTRREKCVLLCQEQEKDLPLKYAETTGGGLALSLPSQPLVQSH